MPEVIFRGFDVDGTIANQGIIPPTVLEAFKIVEENGGQSTILTGKGIYTLSKTLGPLADIILPPNRPFSVEGGGRVVSRSSIAEGRNLAYHPLSEHEIDEALTFCAVQPLEFFAYYREDPRAKAFMWTPSTDETILQNMQQKFGGFAEIHSPIDISLDEVRQHMLADKPAIITIRVSDIQTTSQNLPKQLNAVPNEGFINITAQGVNKGTALMEISEIMGVSLEEVGYAGNDLNDEEAFRVACGEIIAVGSYGDRLDQRTQANDFIQVNTPGGLGEYIRTYPRGRRR